MSRMRVDRERIGSFCTRGERYFWLQQRFWFSTAGICDLLLSPSPLETSCSQILIALNGKSVSDLFGSFASDRMYTQVESMGKHYQCPCLLINFLIRRRLTVFRTPRRSTQTFVRTEYVRKCCCWLCIFPTYVYSGVEARTKRRSFLRHWSRITKKWT